MKIKPNHLSGQSELRDGAQRSRRFNVASPSSLRVLKWAEARAPKRSESGMATILFIALLAIMMILVTAEARALMHLRREVKFLEQQQIKRLNGSPTNVVVTVSPETK